MIELKLYDNLNIQINTDNWDYLRSVKEYFSYYKEGYRFSPLFKVGKWDGKISLFDSMRRTLPYGLLLELIKFNKKEWSNENIVVSSEVKSLFKGAEPVYDDNLLYKTYPYQDDCIKTMLKAGKGIVRVGTGGGKSLIISHILMSLKKQSYIDSDNKAILIVPSIGLVTQFYSDMKEYGIDMSSIGRVGDDWKEWDNEIVISTWQSLKNCPERMAQYKVVIVDEVQGAKAKVLLDLLNIACNAVFRYGVTGTLPDDTLEYNQILSYIGPVHREYGTAYLSEHGYIAKCNIRLVHLDYRNKFKGSYDEIKDLVFTNDYRMGLITEIVKNTEGSILLLVGKVEAEGDVLCKLLMESSVLQDREVCFLSGKDKAKEREFWRNYTDKSKSVVLIATYGIFQAGINIKSLAHLILASPFKSKIRILQSIGRTLRLHGDKINGSTIWDICDNTKHLKDHSNIRIKHYCREKFEMEEMFLMEGDRVEIKKPS